MRYYIVSLGCPKNAVDAEGMGSLLSAAGHQAVADPGDADLVIVNTCGFIESARKESLQVLDELARDKRPNQRLIAAGCLSQREGVALARQARGLDGILGTQRWPEVLALVERLSRQRPVGQRTLGHMPLTLVGALEMDGCAEIPRVAVQGYSAYLKIADGCSAPCAFCAIPLIKGPLHSRPVSEILADARYLEQQGVQEILLIAQDTTAYGRDRGEPDALPALLDELVEAVPKTPWIRLMYAYPQHISPTLIASMARHEQVLHYLDLPLQHAHPDVLRRMRRPANLDRVRALIADLRQAMPDIALRTTFIVGYPGETESEFRALESFLEEIQFDKVGVFTYSPEPGTPAYDLPDPVPEPVAEERLHRLMSRQQGISLARNQAQVGRILEVLIEGLGEVEVENVPESPPGERQDATPAVISLGRSYRDAPEIDGLVLIEDEVEPGEMIDVRISGAMEYDLVGVRARRPNRPKAPR
jgi:ribosomal protein S12 methylthiotransferase